MVCPAALKIALSFCFLFAAAKLTRQGFTKASIKRKVMRKTRRDKVHMSQMAQVILVVTIHHNTSFRLASEIYSD